MPRQEWGEGHRRLSAEAPDEKRDGGIMVFRFGTQAASDFSHSRKHIRYTVGHANCDLHCLGPSRVQRRDNANLRNLYT